MTLRRVGILGGMGPQATVLLMQKVIDAVSVADDSGHVPLLVDQNPQVPSRIARLIDGTGANPAPVLAEMARRLERAGALALAMPCNTAHHFAPAIRAAVGVPFIDMVALSVRHAAELAGGAGKVGILASPAIHRIGLFDAPFADAGLEPVYPADEAAMLAAIRSLKSDGPAAASRAALARASRDLLGSGARVQVIACTEFSLIAGSACGAAIALDTLDVLARAIVRFAHAEGAGGIDAAER